MGNFSITFQFKEYLTTKQNNRECGTNTNPYSRKALSDHLHRGFFLIQMQHISQDTRPTVTRVHSYIPAGKPILVEWMIIITNMKHRDLKSDWVLHHSNLTSCQAILLWWTCDGQNDEHFLKCLRIH